MLLVQPYAPAMTHDMVHHSENETPSTPTTKSPEEQEQQPTQIISPANLHSVGLNQSIKQLTRRQQRRTKQRQLNGGPTSIDDAQAITVNIRSLSISTPTMAQPTRLLVCSIGNPGSYINTFHSAGHTVILSLAHALHYPPFAKSRAYGNGLVSAGEYTLWQSGSLMNISGVGVATAWKEFLRGVRDGEEAKLVVLHDELEGTLGTVKVRDGNLSPKGHNGLKSIKEQLKGAPYTRIGVGIGRPISRDPNAVSSYVLKKMSGVERAKVEGCVGKVIEELKKLSTA